MSNDRRGTEVNETCGCKPDVKHVGILDSSECQASGLVEEIERLKARLFEMQRELDTDALTNNVIEDSLQSKLRAKQERITELETALAAIKNICQEERIPSVQIYEMADEVLTGKPDYNEQSDDMGFPFPGSYS
jgi:hypothetical protein